jgi:hypothetical protein
VQVAAQRGELRGGGRVAGDVTVSLPDDTGLRRDVEVDSLAVSDHDLGRAAADIEDHCRAALW